MAQQKTTEYAGYLWKVYNIRLEKTFAGFDEIVSEYD